MHKICGQLCAFTTLLRYASAAVHHVRRHSTYLVSELAVVIATKHKLRLSNTLLLQSTFNQQTDYIQTLTINNPLPMLSVSIIHSNQLTFLKVIQKTKCVVFLNILPYLSAGLCFPFLQHQSSTVISALHYHSTQKTQCN